MDEIYDIVKFALTEYELIKGFFWAFTTDN